MNAEPSLKESFPFVVAVSLYDTAEEEFVFDQGEVLVGRSSAADLHIAHPAISRRQLTIQRIIPPAAFLGRPRFRAQLRGGPEHRGRGQLRFRRARETD